jgi:two-component system nitrogen regulation sensor histidine kinase NtrY
VLVNDQVLKIFGLKDIERLEDLDRVQEDLSQRLSGLRYDSGNILHIGSDGNDTLPVLVRVSALKLGGRQLRILSLQGIKNELEANEIESWQKLTRVLAHEISNSVTPISTLGAGIFRKLSKASIDKNGAMYLPVNISRDLLQSAELIESRSNSLVEFTEQYKNFTRLPEPVPEKAEVSGFLDGLVIFFNRDIQKQNIQIKTEVIDKDLFVWADRGLLEQAFINLVRNSIEALEEQEHGIIILKAFRKDDRVLIELSDNGPGISQDIQPQVFIPFFTTKPAGTGIGLSIVRKIVLTNGGSISFTSEPGTGTSFMIDLPAV